MKINRNNYEAFLLDWMEGNLSQADQQKLRDFLQLNPDYAMLHDHSDPWILEVHKVGFSGKELLKKKFPNAASSLTASNFDLFSIARMEGDLTIAQEEAHESMVEKDAGRRSEWVQWKQTKLLAPAVEFQGKDKLKKSKGIRNRIIWLSVVSAAAAVALLFTLLRMDTALPEMEVAVKTPAQVPVVEDQQSDPGPAASTIAEEAIAAADEPVMFSIKKNPDRPVESVVESESRNTAEKEDSLLHLQPENVVSRPVRLASYEAYGSELMRKSEYDEIRPLNLPPSEIHMSSFSLAQISEIDLQEVFEDYTEEKDISLLSIANAGISGINKLTGAEISLLASRDEEGDVTGFRLKSKRFSITRPIDQSE